MGNIVNLITYHCVMVIMTFLSKHSFSSIQLTHELVIIHTIKQQNKAYNYLIWNRKYLKLSYYETEWLYQQNEYFLEFWAWINVCNFIFFEQQNIWQGHFINSPPSKKNWVFFFNWFWSLRKTTCSHWLSAILVK